MDAGNIIGIITGVLSTGFIGWCYLTFCSHFLPSGKLRRLDSTLIETISLIDTAMEEGLLPQQDQESFKDRIVKARKEVNKKRYTVLSYSTLVAECIAAWGGLNSDLDALEETVSGIRQGVIVCSEKERKRLDEDEEQRISSPSSVAYAGNEDSRVKTEVTVATFPSPDFNPWTSTPPGVQDNLVDPHFVADRISLSSHSSGASSCTVVSEVVTREPHKVATVAIHTTAHEVVAERLSTHNGNADAVFERLERLAEELQAVKDVMQSFLAPEIAPSSTAPATNPTASLNSNE